MDLWQGLETLGRHNLEAAISFYLKRSGMQVNLDCILTASRWCPMANDSQIVFTVVHATKPAPPSYYDQTTDRPEVLTISPSPWSLLLTETLVMICM